MIFLQVFGIGILGGMFFWWVIRPLGKWSLRWVADYITDWRGLKDGCDFTTRSTNGGTFFWAKSKEAKKILDDIVFQIRAQGGKVRTRWIRFGGVFIYDRQWAHLTYDAINNQAGYPIANLCSLDSRMPGMTIIDT